MTWILTASAAETVAVSRASRVSQTAVMITAKQVSTG